MTISLYALKDQLSDLRIKFNNAVSSPDISIDRHREITEACENEVEKLGYSHELLYANDDLFSLLFSTAEKRPEVLEQYKLK